MYYMNTTRNIYLDIVIPGQNPIMYRRYDSPTDVYNDLYTLQYCRIFTYAYKCLQESGFSE